MKTLSFIMLAATSLFISCSANELSKAEALRILKKGGEYPKVYQYSIHCGSPDDAEFLIKLGFEANGLVTIREVNSGPLQMGEPLIRFEKTANPYLIYGSQDEMYEDFMYNIQKVKIADEDITEVTSVDIDRSAKTASVRYTTVFKNLTPFGKLVKKRLDEPQTENVATFLYTDNGEWLLAEHSLVDM